MSSFRKNIFRNSPASQTDFFLLALLTAATRIPFFAKTFFEFDSLNYAVAIFRFDLSQDTPHLPGYILHVGIAKLLYFLTGGVNTAFVLESFLLSLGSVWFVWWGIRQCASNRTAFWGALVWLFNPIFWFYGCVAAVYPHEAFFTSAVAAMCLRYCMDVDRQRSRALWPVAIAITIGVAGAARQSSMVFLAPTFVVALWSVRAPFVVWLKSILAGGVIVAISFSILFMLAGGFARYRELASAVTLVQSYSVLFNGSLARQLDMIGRLLFSLIIGTAPLWILVCAALIRNFRATMLLLRRAMHSVAVRIFVALVLPPLAFYTLVYYAKPGYLLGVFAVSMIAAAIFCERVDVAQKKSFVKIWSIAWIGIWGIYFLVPLPGKSLENMHHQVAYGSTTLEVSNRYPGLQAKLDAALSKLFLYASSAGIAAFDTENLAILGALDHLPSPSEHQVFLGTRWSQWAFYYRPQMMTYDIILMNDQQRNAFAEQHWTKREIIDTIEYLPANNEDVVLQIWSGHWAMHDIQQQVHLEQIPMPQYLDLYKITDQHFRLKLGNTTFVK